MYRFVLASNNKHKAEEIKAILGGEFEVITQREAGAGDIEVVEDGKTFEENAALKAVAIMNALNAPTIADDSGLCVDYLGGAPGVYTARYAGENASDDENIDKLLAELNGVAPERRTAEFVCVIAVAFPGEEVRTFRGVCPGRITEERAGEGGFGYDPVFFSDEYDMTLAQMDPDIKNSIGHRSAALKKAAEYIKSR